MEDNLTYCKMCGEQYDWGNQDVPEDATIYWEPHCPVCNANFTCVPVDETWLNIVSDTLRRLEKDSDEFDKYLEKIHVQSRFCHGRMYDVTVEELIDRAKWFDERERNSRMGPNKYHPVAFTLRKQARKKLY